MTEVAIYTSGVIVTYILIYIIDSMFIPRPREIYEFFVVFFISCLWPILAFILTIVFLFYFFVVKVFWKDYEN